MPHLNEAGLKCQYVRLKYCKALWVTLPINLPIRESSPAQTVHKEREFGITEEEIFAGDTLHM